MNHTDKLRLLRKLAMLVILLAGFVLASSDMTVRQSAAAPCCSQCEAREAYCETLPEPNRTTCLQNNFNCWRWCSFSC
jgi:hypothetical protein